jgi:protein O-GlcNAc transferase
MRGLRVQIGVLAFLSLIVPARGFAAQAPKPANAEAIQRATTAFREGSAAQQAGNYQAARVKFAEAVRLAPAIPEAHEALGAVLLELNQPAEAVSELETALKLKPADPGIETNLALAYASAGKPDKAIPYFQAVYTESQQPGQSPVNEAFCEAYARALNDLGKPVEALQLFEAAVERGGDRADLDDEIGMLEWQLRQSDQARAEFEKAIASDKSYFLASVHLGVLLRQQHDLTGSVEVLSQAAAINPQNLQVQFELGRSLEAAGRDEEALPHLRKAAETEVKPDLLGTSAELAMALQRLGREEEAIPWFRQAIERNPRDASALNNLALALTLTGKATDAMYYFQQALAIEPNDVTIRKDLGFAHIQLSAFDEAIADFKSALALDPDDAQLHYDLGLAYKFKDRMDEAVAELSRAAQLDPTLQDPPYTLGILYMQLGKLDDAVIELKKAVALRPDNGDAWAILGSTLKQDSRYDEARDALEKAIPLLPGQPGPRVTLAGVLADQASAASQAADASEAAGNAQKAEQLRAQAKELRSQAAEYRRQAAELSRAAVNRQRAEFALNAGNQLLLKGQVADAVARYQEAIAADPTYAEAHSQLAVAYDRQGRTADASAERAKATNLASAK